MGLDKKLEDYLVFILLLFYNYEYDKREYLKLKKKFEGLVFFFFLLFYVVGCNWERGRGGEMIF